MKLEGEIGEIDVIERLVGLWREQFTGAIRFENDAIIKIIYFKNGDVLSASTNDRSDSIDEILMKAGKVSRDHVKQALAKRKETETLGDALLNLGFITRKELSWARRVQVIGVIRSIAAWTEGSFTIVADYLPKREEGTLFPLPQLIVELIVTEQDRARFERALDGGDAVFERSGDFDGVFRRLGLNEDADQIVAQVDGERAASEVAVASGKDAFNVYKLLHALVVLGILQRKARAAHEVLPPIVTSETPFDSMSFENAGVADAADMWGAPSSGPEISGMSFELDDVPTPMQSYQSPTPMQTSPTTMEIPAIRMPEPEPEPEPVPMWEPGPEPAPEMAASPMPAWDAVPPTPLEDARTPEPRTPEPMATERMATAPPWAADSIAAAPPVMAAPLTPPTPVKEEQWGFDEAQIDAARRAAVPVRSTTDVPPPMAPPPSRKGGPTARSKKSGSRSIVTALVAILLGAGLYLGAKWYLNRPVESDVVVTRPVRQAPRKIVPPPAPAPASPMVISAAPLADTTGTTATSATSATAPPPATTTVAAVPRPTPIAAAPVPGTPASGTRVERTTTGGAVITNSGGATNAAAAANSPLRARYDAMAREHAANVRGAYTVQFGILCDPGNVKKAVDSGGDNVWFVPMSFRGKPCYRVFWGRYDSRDAAEGGKGQMPASLRSSGVVVSTPK